MKKFIVVVLAVSGLLACGAPHPDAAVVAEQIDSTLCDKVVMCLPGLYPSATECDKEVRSSGSTSSGVDTCDQDQLNKCYDDISNLDCGSVIILISSKGTMSLPASCNGC